MNWGKKLVTLVVAIIFGLSLILAPVVSPISPVQAAVSWTKYTGEVTLDSAQLVADAWVIKDDGIYKMWYTHGKVDLAIGDMVDDIRGLNLDDIIDSIASEDLDQFLNELGDLVPDIATVWDILNNKVSTVIGYATSTNGTTWTMQNSRVLFGSNGVLDSVGAPCVIKDDNEADPQKRYKMWYTHAESILTQADLSDILTDLGGTIEDRTDAILDLLSSSSTVIGYATSSDGEDWTVQNDEVLPSGDDIFWSVGAPCVILDDTTYEMWYSRSDADLPQAELDAILLDIGNFGIADLLDLLDSTAVVIGYATSSDGESWAVQDREVLPGNTGAWDSVADPCVIKNSAADYEMWYTNGTTDLTVADLSTLLDEIIALGPVALWNTLKNDGLAEFLLDLWALDLTDIEDIVSDSSTVIGYATSTDGLVWTVQNTPDLTGSSDSLWSSVAAPSVVKTGSTYEMWYTEGIADLTLHGILDLYTGDDLPIGFASYTPAAGGGGGITTEEGPTVEVVEEMDPDEAGDVLGELAEEDPEAAGDILGELGEVDPDFAGDILRELGEDDPEIAGDILEEVVGDDPEIAGDILEEVVEDDPEVAGDILGGMDVELAAMVMEELSTDALTDVVPEMSEEALTETLPGLSPEALYSVDPEVLFDSLPNAPTEQLVSEEPPEPPTEATAPVVVYTTPSGARYLAIQTWAGEWVVVMRTPAPIDELMIKTKRALTNVETTVEIFERRPSEVPVRLSSEQVAWTYFEVSFENAEPEDIEVGHITFYVEKEWLEENSIHKWSIALNRYDPELRQWIALPTKRVEEDDENVYYTAVISKFSYFAVSGSETMPPLNFEVADLVISPVEVEDGVATINISADVTNISDETGTYVATLWIDGTIEAGQDVTVDADETEPVSFTVTRQTAGSYEVRLDRLYGNFTITEVEEIVEEVEQPATFVPSVLTISPSHVRTGEEVTIGVVVTNVGDLSGSYEVVLKIDNVVEATEEITLAGHTSQTATFTTSRDVTGTYSVTVDGLSGTFEVRVPAAPPPREVNWWILGGVIVVVILIGWFIWWAVRR